MSRLAQELRKEADGSVNPSSANDQLGNLEEEPEVL